MEYTNQEQRIRELLNELNNKLLHSTSNKKRIAILSEIEFLEYFIKLNNLNIFIPLNIKLNKYIEKDIRIVKKEKELFKENYINMFEINTKVSNLGESFQNTLGCYHCGEPKKRLDLNNAIDLVENFFLKYDKDIYKFYKALKDKQLIYTVDDDGIYGATYNFPTEGTSILFINDKKTIDTALTIVHETIHAYINSYNYYTSFEQEVLKNVNNLQEVYTEFIELLFLDYLKEIKYDQKDVGKATATINYLFVKDLLCYSDFLNFFTADDILYDENTYMTFCNYESYTYGKLLAKIYYDLYNQDKEKTKENLLNLSIDQYYKDKRYLINNYGFKENELVNIKKIQRYLKK